MLLHKTKDHRDQYLQVSLIFSADLHEEDFGLCWASWSKHLSEVRDLKGRCHLWIIPLGASFPLCLQSSLPRWTTAQLWAEGGSTAKRQGSRLEFHRYHHHNRALRKYTCVCVCMYIYQSLYGLQTPLQSLELARAGQLFWVLPTSRSVSEHPDSKLQRFNN